MTEQDLKAIDNDDEFLAQVDRFLQVLVHSANRGGELPITLQVDGLLISGILVGGADYFVGFAEDFATGLTGEDAVQAKASFLEMAASYRERGDEGETDMSNLAKTQFIHLRDARFFGGAGGPIPANRGVWWRGRISAVSGFNLGTLSASKE